MVDKVHTKKHQGHNMEWGYWLALGLAVWILLGAIFLSLGVAAKRYDEAVERDFDRDVAALETKE